jgi:DNA excision repair protein ERCC-4
MPARIIVDERERPSGIPDLLKKAGASVDYAQLQVGDYVVSPDTAVERKTVHDLVHSIYDGRLYVQCSELLKHYARPVVVIQGDISGLKEVPADADGSRVKKLQDRLPAALDALATLALEFRIPVIHVPDAEQAAHLLVSMAGKGNGVQGPLLKKIKKENPVHLQQLSVLSSVPGVGEKLAARMLAKFGTPHRALSASAAELATIPGFGLARAQKVRKVLDSAARRNSIAQRTLFEQDNEK